MKIHAFAAKSPRGLLEPFSYDTGTLAPFEVLIRLSHCGLCYTDVHLIDNDWNRSLYPLVPGHEAVGVVVQTGQGAVVPVGARVGVSWLYSSCLQCSICLSGETQVCPHKKATCIGHHGGFATHMTADSRFVYEIPAALDSALAAPLLCAGATVYAPLRRFKIQAPHRIAVVGIGGLGHLALQFARAFGCDVTAISSSDQKREEALGFGAHHFVTIDRLESLEGVFDLILSTTHGPVDLNQMCTLLNPTGTLCLLGKSPTSLELNPLVALSAQRAITGSSVANRYLMREMLQFAADHQIHPAIEIVRLEQVNEALERVRSNRARYRIVLAMQ